MKVALLLAIAVALLAGLSRIPVTAQAPTPRLTVVISDLHIGGGRSADGQWLATEDFRWSTEFARFLEAISRAGNAAVDLIVNGDGFELATPDCAAGDGSAGCSESAALARLATILKQHDVEIDALGRFARAGSNQLTFVPGDQDAALLFPQVASRLVAALESGDRADVAQSGYWLSADGQIYAEHGHQIGFSAHRFEGWPSPFLMLPAGRRLARPSGEILAQDFYARYENQFPLIDNFAALGTGLKYAVTPDDSRSDAFTSQLLRSLMLTIAWQQFRMELDDGDVQPPAWDLAQVRAQGASFIVTSLPDDDPLKAVAVKAVAAGWLTQMKWSDEELVALCDYRAAIRRSRRRLEPTLTQLQPRGPAVTECPRTPDTRGAAFEYFWRSRDQMFLRHLETIRGRIPARGQPIRVLVSGHTHLPDRGQSGANMISGGLLKIPMEGFSPVRGALTPIMINGGAWQRTITPVQFERRAADAAKTVGDLMRTLKPEDLPDCYSFVQVLLDNGVATPAVRYWRQAGSGSWEVGSSCAASG